MANLHRAVKIWRQARFRSPKIRDELERRGTTGRQTLGAALLNLKARKGLDKRDNLDAEQCTDDDLVFLEKETREALLLKGFKGFLHNDEWARAFFGSGKNIFAEMARCWKCYFLHDCSTNDVALTLEEGRMTVLAANEPLSCAEDLCKSICLRSPNPIAFPPLGTGEI